MKHSNTANGQKGFSLLEVMVATGVAAILTYAISQMLVNSGKQAATVASKSDFNTLVNQFQGAFNNTGTCLAAVNGSTTLKLPVQDLSKGFPIPAALVLGGTTYQTGSTYGGPQTKAGQVSKRALKITKLEYAGATPANGTSAATTSQYIVPLNLVIDRSVGNENAVGGNTLTKTFNLILTVDLKNPNKDGSLNVNGCAGQYTDFWSSTGDGQDIIYSGGKVAIGACAGGAGDALCVDPPQAALDVGGTMQATAFMYRSDARLKENVREIPDALSRVLKLRGVLFDWKNPDAGKDQLGLIAQEVEQVFPEVVETNPNGLKTVGYANLLAPLVEAFKQQKEIIERQSREIAELKRAVQQSRGGSR